MAVRPLRLADPDEKPGYDHLDGISMWFLAGAAGGAEATGVVDDDRYGLDLVNSGAGGLSLRATSGNGSHAIKVDNTSATVTGGLTITGGGMTVASLVVLGTSSFTGAATFSTGVAVGGSLGVTGALTVTGAATFVAGAAVGGSLTVTGPATFVTSVQIQGVFSADSTVNLGNSDTDVVNVAGDLAVVHDVTIGNATAGSFLVGSQTLWADPQNNRVGIGTNAPDAAYVFDVNGDVRFQDNLYVAGSLNLNFGSTSGFTNASGAWSGYVIIQHDGNDKYVPYLSSAP